MRTTRFFFGLFVLVAALLMGSCKKQATTQENGNYKTITISRGTSTVDHEYTATLEGVQAVEVRPQVSGTITRVLVSEGAHVRKGQVMFVLDQVPYRAALANAEAQVRSARAAVATARLTLRSKQQLYGQHVVSDYDVAQARNSLNEAVANLQNAEASVISARNNLSYTEVKSPADGVIGMLPYRVGALVSSTIEQPLATVSDNNTVYAYFSVSESQMQQLIDKYGSLEKAVAQLPRVKLRLSDGTIYKEAGHVDAISGNVDAETGAVTLRASFPNNQSLLRNGGTGTVIVPYTMQNIVVIPQEATYELQDKKFVYRVVNGVTKSTEIQVSDDDNGKQYIVTSGLKPGDVIIAEGAGLLHDGIKVNKK